MNQNLAAKAKIQGVPGLYRNVFNTDGSNTRTFTVDASYSGPSVTVVGQVDLEFTGTYFDSSLPTGGVLFSETRNYIHSIRMGRNDVGKPNYSQSESLSNIASVVAHIQTFNKKFYVMGVTSAYSDLPTSMGGTKTETESVEIMTQIRDLNLALSEIYGSNFVDIQAAMIAAGYGQTVAVSGNQYTILNNIWSIDGVHESSVGKLATANHIINNVFKVKGGFKMYIVKLDQEFTDSNLPILYPDSIMNVGSLALFDFTNKNCWDPLNIVENNAPVHNLVENGPDAYLNIGASDDLTFVAEKGFKYSEKNNLLSNIVIGTGNDLLQTENDFAISLWVTAPDPQLALSQVASTILVKQKDYNSNDGRNNTGIQLYLESNQSNSTSFSKVSYKLGGGGGVRDLETTISQTVGLFHLVLAKVTNSTKLYVNKELKLSGAYQSSFVNTYPMQLGRPLNQISGGDFSGANTLIGALYHRLYIEDLSLSNRSLLDFIDKEYELNYERF